MRPALPLADAPAPPHYRPRHPERAPIYRVLERRFDDYVYAHEERYEERHGALRKVVPRSVTRYLECGRLMGGFARIPCPTCHDEHLLAFSCRTRNLCPSCQAKRSVLFAERLREDALEPCPPVGRRSRTTSARAGAARERRTGLYVTRPALATGAVTLREDGRVAVATPPDPKTGAEGVVLDVLDFVHAVVTQIPDAGKHLLRYYYGAYSHKVRGRARAAAASPTAEAAGTPTTPGAPEPSAAPAPCEPVVPAEPGSPEARRRSAWARVLQKVFEVDPLLCPGAARR